ncbi:MAG: DUF6968 family protein [Bosea sp. (in: a-proteobacteria)]
MIATRVLGLLLNGKLHELEVRIYAPEQNGDSWDCRYEIDWPEGTQRMVMGGFDSAQALLLAFYMIGADLNSSSYHREGRLIWGEAGEGLGFPVAATMRDLLVGDDKRFFG